MRRYSFRHSNVKHSTLQAQAAAQFKDTLITGAGVAFPICIRSPTLVSRATALNGDAAGSRKAYEAFFAVWKDTDSDLPLLLTARHEYQRLK